MNAVELTALLGALAAVLTSVLGILAQRRSRLTHKQIESVASFQKLNDGLDREVQRLSNEMKSLRELFETCKITLYATQDELHDFESVLTIDQRSKVQHLKESRNAIRELGEESL